MRLQVRANIGETNTRAAYVREQTNEAERNPAPGVCQQKLINGDAG